MARAMKALLLLPPLLMASADTDTCDGDHCRDQDSLLQTRHTKPNQVPEAADQSVHFIYTVGCNHYQLVQAVVLDHTWKEVGNKGHLTRIAVGCDDEKSRALLGSSPLEGDERFSVFFSKGELMMVPGKNDKYPARSRPYAIGQWLEATKPKQNVVAILDPDFVFDQPITSHPDLPKVRPGQMLAQQYDLDRSFMPGFQAAGEATPELSHDDAVNHYATGPPWVLHMEDLKKMIPEWGRYTDAWPKEKGLLREQDAFCMAALKHNVPSIGQSNFMISNPVAWHEAWSDKSTQLGSWKPYVFHYCQTYSYGNWSFYKSMITDDDTFGHNAIPGPTHCGAPLLQEPPAPPADETDREKYMHAWMLWKLFPAMNKALAAYQEKYCKPEQITKTGESRLVMRTRQPIQCKTSTTTRYIVKPGASAVWHSTGAEGEDVCGDAAQAWSI